MQLLLTVSLCCSGGFVPCSSIQIQPPTVDHWKRQLGRCGVATWRLLCTHLPLAQTPPIYYTEWFLGSMSTCWNNNCAGQITIYMLRKAEVIWFKFLSISSFRESLYVICAQQSTSKFNPNPQKVHINGEPTCTFLNSVYIPHTSLTNCVLCMHIPHTRIMLSTPLVMYVD